MNRTPTCKNWLFLLFKKNDIIKFPCPIDPLSTDSVQPICGRGAMESVPIVAAFSRERWQITPVSLTPCDAVCLSPCITRCPLTGRPTSVYNRRTTRVISEWVDLIPRRTLEPSRRISFDKIGQKIRRAATADVVQLWTSDQYVWVRHNLTGCSVNPSRQLFTGPLCRWSARSRGTGVRAVRLL